MEACPVSQKNRKLDSTFNAGDLHKKIPDESAKAVLADEYTQNVQSVDVFSTKILNPKSTPDILNNLNKFYPLPSLNHLKRIRSVRDDKTVLLSVVLDLVQSRTLTDFKKELVNNGFDKLDIDLDVQVTKVSSTPPKTRKQFEEASLLWPCNFREDKYLESLLNNNYFTSDDRKKHVDYMTAAIEAANESFKIGGNGIGAVVVDPKTNKRVAVGFDCSHVHPLQHAIMVLIDQVAKSQGGGAWVSNQKWWFDETLVKESRSCNFKKSGRQNLKRDSAQLYFGDSVNRTNEVPKTGPYLCTGYDVYVTREPCTMCAMALVHSRARRIFYGCPNPSGALGTLQKLHTKKELNHHYEVFCGLLSEQCKAFKNS